LAQHPRHSSCFTSDWRAPGLRPAPNSCCDARR
jgi:hypothetical protein